MKEQVLKERLKRAANDLNIAFNDAWHQLILQRFLVRLSISSYADRFILKGGMLLAHYIDLERETRDIDFLVTRMQIEKARIQTALEEIVNQDPFDDFSFKFTSINDLAHVHMKYPGFTAKISAQIGNMKGTINIDIGIGDLVDPIKDSLELMTASEKPLFEDVISLLVYPPETIFAEKLQTAAARGSANSRMKDYHDLISIIINERMIDKNRLVSQIKKTFSHRSSDLRLLPLKFSEKELGQLQNYWKSYKEKQKNRGKNLPDSIDAVISVINNWLSAISLF